jgi:hypothetical protein
MNPPADNPNLLAAEGYVELGLLGDALEEIEGLPADVSESVECVAVRLAIHKAASVAKAGHGQNP